MRCQEEVPSEGCRLESESGLRHSASSSGRPLLCFALSHLLLRLFIPRPSHSAYRNPTLAECPVHMLLSPLFPVGSCFSLFRVFSYSPYPDCSKGPCSNPSYSIALCQVMIHLCSKASFHQLHCRLLGVRTSVLDNSVFPRGTQSVPNKIMGRGIVCTH